MKAVRGGGEQCNLRLSSLIVDDTTSLIATSTMPSIQKSRGRFVTNKQKGKP
jgi:hypothetical protein